MNLATELAMTSYYLGTLPWRLGWRQRLETQGQAPICVLFYHRIADTVPNGWTMSSAQFERQINWLQQHFDIISLAEAQRRIESGSNHRISATITFDDGYSDNCQRAIPFLLNHQIPFTYFVALDFALTGRPFPHDVQAGRPLPPNSMAQLRDMARRGIDIGAHTRTHADLGAVTDPEFVFDEIVTSSRELADAVEAPVDYFAFPFGHHTNMTDQAFQLARQAGMRGVCSAYGNYNLPGSDPFHIQRIHGDPEFIRLKNWLTLDPRKLGRIDSYEVDWVAPR